uniref:Uncharacterized protein n=1 Tax=Marseillevirus LCMAC101 TaxID=2506602 RepID=A0A481YRS4_9VIRU|nr:MAG: hypothetical protein LCMAC101_02650 [Marseillevirus LCMAC101]
MAQKIQLSREEFENLEAVKLFNDQLVERGTDSLDQVARPSHTRTLEFVTLKLIVVYQDDLRKFLEDEYEKLTEERHSCLGVPLKLFYEDKVILRYTSMSRFFTSSFNEAISKKKFADFGEDIPEWNQIFPWVGKYPSGEEIKTYYINKFSISPDETVRWGVIYF